MTTPWRTAVVAAVLVAAAAWGYLSVYHVSVKPAVATRVAHHWLGPINQSVAESTRRLAIVGYDGYLHRDWEFQEIVCTPSMAGCQTSYGYTVFVNGQTGRVDRAMINTGPGVAGWPLPVDKPAHAQGGS